MNTSVIRFRSSRRDELDDGFLFYFLKSSLFRNQALSFAIGSAQPNFGPIHLREMRILLAPLVVQRKIAGMLTTYDNLIENNMRRTRILEEMIQTIYREWFVYFRFPNHQRVQMTDSEVGRIPQGWSAQPIGNVVETTGGSTPSTKNPQFWVDGDVTWFIPSDLTKLFGGMFVFDPEKKITRLGLKSSSARLFPPYSVMMTSRATIGVTAINTKEACTNQGFITCIPSDRLSTYHIYFWIKGNLERISSIASGATYKEINRTEFRSLPIVVPDVATARQFLETVGPIGRQIEILSARNINLRQTRDLLLPKLISGKVDVSDSGIIPGPADA
jgi:type I restriction enzyme S subunit